MKLTISGKEYAFKFKHTQEGGPRVIGKLGGEIPAEPLVRHTACTIVDSSQEESQDFVAIGFAKCHPNDNFSKEKGRQKSLAKALEDACFTKSERGDVWHTYRNWNKERF